MPRKVSRRALTLPARALKIIKEYKAFNNLQLRAAVREYFENKVLCELRHGKINTWDVITVRARLLYITNNYVPKIEIYSSLVGKVTGLSRLLRLGLPP